MLNIFIDTSGSMSELGKLSGALYVARGLEASFGGVIFYDLSGEKIENLNEIKIENKPPFFQAQLPLTPHVLGETNILFSDGIFEYERDEKIFDLALAFGLDSNMDLLAKISKKVYEADEILEFLDELNISKNKDDSGAESWE